MLILLGSTVMAAVLGMIESRRVLRRNPEIGIKTIHKRIRYLVPVTVAAITVATTIILIGFHQAAMWALPMWLSLNFRIILWSLILSLTSFLFSLGIATAIRTRHKHHWVLLALGIALIGALFSTQYRLYRPIADSLQESIGADGFVHQSSAVSCAAASGANIARMVGLDLTERDMADLMGTSVIGTELPRIERAMRDIGFMTQRVQVKDADIDVVRSPAMLFVDHPQTGPESHVVAYFGSSGGAYEIWDPLEGRIHMDRTRLLAYWHGRGVELRYSRTGKIR